MYTRLLEIFFRDGYLLYLRLDMLPLVAYTTFNYASLLTIVSFIVLGLVCYVTRKR